MFIYTFWLCWIFFGELWVVELSWGILLPLCL